MWDSLAIDWGEKYFGIAKANSDSKIIIPYNQEALNSNIWLILENLTTQNKFNKLLSVSQLILSLKPLELLKK
jgi:RNase H-fold protein (predicted Holliday junction resolvase)